MYFVHYVEQILQKNSETLFDLSAVLESERKAFLIMLLQ